MAIARKPKVKEPSETDVTAIINKGGTVPNEKGQGQEKQQSGSKHSVVLHIPGDWITEIDRLVSKRRVKTSRHTWLLEAIIEKLDHEK